jgi:uncharacterized protein with GYD domain
MSKYILLSRVTEQGRRTIKQNPERIKEVNSEVEKMGAKVLSQYALLGMYDFLTVIEAPNNETIAKVSVEFSSRGTVEIQSLPAFEVDDFINMVKKQAKGGGKPKPKS